MLLGSVVLAGGQSRRMGRPKAGLQIGETTLLGRAVDTLLLCTHPVLVVGRSDHDELPPLPIESELTFDSEPDQGPLSGLVDGLRWHAKRKECDAVIVVGCDMPFLDAGAIGWLAAQLGDHDLVIPEHDGALQPLAAIYRLSVLPAAEKLLRSGERGPKALTALVNTKVLGASELAKHDPKVRFLRSVDTPEEYETLRREFGH